MVSLPPIPKKPILPQKPVYRGYQQRPNYLAGVNPNTKISMHKLIEAAKQPTLSEAQRLKYCHQLANLLLVGAQSHQELIQRFKDVGVGVILSNSEPKVEQFLKDSQCNGKFSPNPFSFGPNKMRLGPTILANPSSPRYRSTLIHEGGHVAQFLTGFHFPKSAHNNTGPFLKDFLNDKPVQLNQSWLKAEYGINDFKKFSESLMTKSYLEIKNYSYLVQQAVPLKICHDLGRMNRLIPKYEALMKFSRFLIR